MVESKELYRTMRYEVSHRHKYPTQKIEKTYFIFQYSLVYTDTLFIVATAINRRLYLFHWWQIKYHRFIFLSLERGNVFFHFIFKLMLSVFFYFITYMSLWAHAFSVGGFPNMSHYFSRSSRLIWPTSGTFILTAHIMATSLMFYYCKRRSTIP